MEEAEEACPGNHPMIANRRMSLSRSQVRLVPANPSTL